MRTTRKSGGQPHFKNVVVRWTTRRSALITNPVGITKKNTSNVNLTEDQRLDLENIGLYVIMSAYPVLNIYLQVISFFVNFPLIKHMMVESA